MISVYGREHDDIYESHELFKEMPFKRVGILFEFHDYWFPCMGW